MYGVNNGVTLFKPRVLFRKLKILLCTLLASVFDFVLFVVSDCRAIALSAFAHVVFSYHFGHLLFVYSGFDVS